MAGHFKGFPGTHHRYPEELQVCMCSNVCFWGLGSLPIWLDHGGERCCMAMRSHRDCEQPGHAQAARPCTSCASGLRQISTFMHVMCAMLVHMVRQPSCSYTSCSGQNELAIHQWTGAAPLTSLRSGGSAERCAKGQAASAINQCCFLCSDALL